MRQATPNIDYTNRDYEAFREMLIDNLQTTMPEYTDTSQSDAGIVILEGLAKGLDVLSMYQDIIANDLLLETTQDRSIAILLAKYLGYTPYNQTTSFTKQVFVLDEEQDTPIIIPKGTIVTTQEEEAVESLSFITQANLIIPSGKLGNEQDPITDEYLYTVDVIQGEAIEEDILGSSNGTAYQRFVLNYTDVLIDYLKVYVETEDGIEEWEQVPSFVDSIIDETSKVYTVDVDDFGNCIVTFGNGVRGKIPPIFEDGITADYIIGGGVKSNVAALTITELDDDIDGVEETFNPEASYIKGHDREPIEEIKQNAPLYFKTLDRAVTLEDFENLLKINNEGAFYGIYNSKALLDENDRLNVLLYYQMREGYTMTDELRAQIADFFSTRKVVGSTITLNAHLTTSVNITANLKVNDDYVQSEVETAVENYIADEFFKEGNFTFGTTYMNSDIENAVYNNVGGVVAFRITSQDVDIVEPEGDEYILDVGLITLTTTGGIVDE